MKMSMTTTKMMTRTMTKTKSEKQVRPGGRNDLA